jgi:hypothetical protein
MPSAVLRSPAVFVAVLAAVSAALVVPLMFLVGPGHWVAFGLFDVQTSRVGMYALYFTAGLLLGAAGMERTFLAAHGKVARGWPIWVLAAPLAFVVLGTLSIVASSSALSGFSNDLLMWGSLAGTAFVVSCAASSFALLAVFLRFADRRLPMMDNLRANAYGIYLVHYAFAS